MATRPTGIIFAYNKQRLAEALKRWQDANARYIQARYTWDQGRLDHLVEETNLWVEFAKAKAAVKDATETYYAVVNEISAWKQAINLGKTRARLAELESQIKETRAKISRG